MSNVFFIGDTHFGHKRIIKMGRLFETVEAHDAELAKRWNSVVGKRDKVYHVGDVAFNTEGLRLVGELNGHKTLIRGNHDKFSTREYLEYFDEVEGMVKYKDWILSHCPVHPQEMMYSWKYNIHGHIHDVAKGVKDPRYQCVSADFIDYTPIELTVLRRKIELEAIGYA